MGTWWATPESSRPDVDGLRRHRRGRWSGADVHASRCATDLHASLPPSSRPARWPPRCANGSAILVMQEQRATIAKGRTVTGFANVEEDFADNAVWSYGLLPPRQARDALAHEDRLKAIGANYVQGGLWRSLRRTRDGNLVTGPAELSAARRAPGHRGARALTRGRRCRSRHPGRRQRRHGAGPRTAARRPAGDDRCARPGALPPMRWPRWAQATLTGNDAAQRGELVILAVPYTARLAASRRRVRTGRASVLVDATNLGWRRGWRAWPGHHHQRCRAGGRTRPRRAWSKPSTPPARRTWPTAATHRPADDAGGRLTMPPRASRCWPGDDDRLRPVDMGRLSSARYLEPMAIGVDPPSVKQGPRGALLRLRASGVHEPTACRRRPAAAAGPRPQGHVVRAVLRPGVRGRRGAVVQRLCAPFRLDRRGPAVPVVAGMWWCWLGHTFMPPASTSSGATSGCWGWCRSSR